MLLAVTLPVWSILKALELINKSSDELPITTPSVVSVVSPIVKPPRVPPSAVIACRIRGIPVKKAPPLINFGFQ